MPPEQRPLLRVIVHADDLGLSDQVNKAIIEALDRGWCSSTSIIANGPAFAAAIPALRRLGDPDVGVHLNLTEFSALRPERLAALFPNGVLGPAACNARTEHEDAIFAEWMAQVAAVRDAGLDPSHLDTHQHLHWRPLFTRVLRRVATASGVRRVRTMGAWRPEVSAIRGLPQRGRAARFTAALRHGPSPLITTDNFANTATFRHRLEHGRRLEGTIEVMAHPGNPAHARYAEELEWLAGPWRDVGPPIERVSWRQIS